MFDAAAERDLFFSQTFTCPTEKNGESRFSASIIMFGGAHLFDLWPINAKRREVNFMYLCLPAFAFPSLAYTELYNRQLWCRLSVWERRTNINLLPSLGVRNYISEMLCARSKFDGNKKQYCTLLVVHRKTKPTHALFYLIVTRVWPMAKNLCF